MQATRFYHCRAISHVIGKGAVRESRSQSAVRFRLAQQQNFQTSIQRLEKPTIRWPSDKALPWPNATSKSSSQTLLEKENLAQSTPAAESTPKAASWMGQSMQQAAERLASSSRAAVSSATHSTAKSLTNLSSLAATKATESANNLASKAAESGKALGSKAAERGAGLVSSSIESIQTKTSGVVDSAGKRITSTVQSSAGVVTNSVQSGFQRVSSTLYSSVKAKVVQPISQYITTSGSGTIRWLWWWSLAAVAVYGVATTVPKELIHVAFDKKKDVEENEE